MQICPACAVYKYKSSELPRTAASSVGGEHRSPQTRTITSGALTCNLLIRCESEGS